MLVVTMRTADLKFDELNYYKYSDKLIDGLKRRCIEEFASAALIIRSTFYDPKKAIAYSKKMYSRLWRDCRRTLLKIGKHYWDECDEEWLWLFLTAYDPVYGVVYDNEQDRKRARFVEGVLSAETVGDKKMHMDRSMRLWLRMVSWMGIEVTDKSSVETMKEAGVKKVRWVTARDERVCEECSDLNDKIFPIDNIPPKPHINCRCMIVPVKG